MHAKYSRLAGQDYTLYLFLPTVAAITWGVYLPNGWTPEEAEIQQVTMTNKRTTIARRSVDGGSVLAKPRCCIAMLL